MITIRSSEGVKEKSKWCAGQSKNQCNECGRCSDKKSKGYLNIFQGTNTYAANKMKLAYDDDYDFSDDGLDEFYQ
jgi:hypothetical protein